MAAAADSKSAALKACGFESHLRHPFLGKSPYAFKTVKRVDEYRQGIVCAKNENKSSAKYTYENRRSRFNINCSLVALPS